jgi:hypothetical protein
MSDSEPNYKAFSKIQKFVSELNNSFKADFPNLTKYNGLVSKTTIDNHKAIHKQVKLFGDFCLQNSDCIKAKDMGKLTDQSIIYNDKFTINLKDIIRKADKASCNVIADHLQLILYRTHPSEELKHSLESSLQTQAASSSANIAQPQNASSVVNSMLFPDNENMTKEEALFASLLTKVEKQYGNNDNLNVNSTLDDMKSNGFIQEIQNTITQGIENNELDFNNLIKGCFGMFNRAKGQTDDPQVNNMINMVEVMLQQTQSSL